MSEHRYNRAKQNIPSEYLPTNKINFCSNVIKNYQYLIKDKDFIPILIGKGEIPRIWLYTMIRGTIFELVGDSVSKMNQIRIDIFNSKQRIEIIEANNSKMILSLDYSDEQFWKINKLNLEPLGYKIIGDEKKVSLGSMTISGNTFDGVQTVIAFDSEPSQNENALV